jgi:UDP-N-acetylmuramoyl-tripeptide--D-alanyl-D-alanine ligase
LRRFWAGKSADYIRRTALKLWLSLAAMAIAQVLSSKYKVQHQEGNYNHIVTAPLVFFGEKTPSLLNPLAWLKVFWRNELQLRRKYPYEIVVVELGTDGPGYIQEFKNYLKVEMAVVTSITPEHMEFFKSLDDVAKEELSVKEFSSLVLANTDLCNSKYLSDVPELLTYGSKQKADYMIDNQDGKLLVKVSAEVIAEIENSNLSQAEQYSLLAASAVAYKLGLSSDEIKSGAKNIKAVVGRLNRLAGINNSTIIDDSYNSSPEAVKLALEMLYQMKSPQKIAVLGNMNELGNFSEAAHTEIGGLCDPKQLDLLVTIGPDANEFLAKAAESKGCKVERFNNPYKAGEFLKPLVKEDAVILVKGSQNKVFAEEAIKSLLKNHKDEESLVRQTPEWMKIKSKAFKS